MKAIKVLSIIFIGIFSFYSSLYAGVFTIPSWVKNSCVFIMKNGEPVGSGFLFFVKDQDNHFCYLVSAKHVIQPILTDPETPLSIRFNLKEKNSAEIINFETYIFNGKRWIEHPNKAVDLSVIVLRIFNVIDKLDVSGKPIESRDDEYVASVNWIRKYKVSQGDQVFTLGLVPYLYSDDEPNMVLSRFGTISLLPDNELLLPGGKQKAYFIDCQAFGGNSGGPAYVLIERSETGALIAGWRFALLGIVTEFVPSPLRMQKIQTDQSEQKEKIQLIENTGITKVVP